MNPDMDDGSFPKVLGDSLARVKIARGRPGAVRAWSGGVSDAGTEGGQSVDGNNGGGTDDGIDSGERGDKELRELAADAYVYGYALVVNLEMVETAVTHGFGSLPATPFNKFAHATELADPEARFVSINNDTLYSVAQLDLSGGPLLLHVPDVHDAYYVLQFVDAWSNNFAYIGTRATGTAEGDWLLVPPGWSGAAPEDAAGVVHVPTAVASIVGRFACAGPNDVGRVLRLQRQLTLAPATATGTTTGTTGGLPAVDASLTDPVLFFERMRLWMAAFPPAAADQAYQERFRPLGLLGEASLASAGPDVQRALADGFADGRARVEAASRGAGEPDGGPGAWLMKPHAFDYNLDHFEVGTLDAPEWRMPDRTGSYLLRAAADRAGLWGNHGYEAVYAFVFTDSEDRPLDGAHRYTLRFDARPPADAFWSVTMYALPEYYLVANPIKRYSIGDRSPGLVYGEDGSLTLAISRERPEDPDEAANWLPAPEGEFRPILRLYMPRAEAFDGTYRIPPIVRR